MRASSIRLWLIRSTSVWHHVNQLILSMLILICLDGRAGLSRSNTWDVSQLQDWKVIKHRHSTRQSIMSFSNFKYITQGVFSEPNIFQTNMCVQRIQESVQQCRDRSTHFSCQSWQIRFKIYWNLVAHGMEGAWPYLNVTLSENGASRYNVLVAHTEINQHGLVD